MHGGALNGDLQVRRMTAEWLPKVMVISLERSRTQEE
jgi:hypothetical protein